MFGTASVEIVTPRSYGGTAAEAEQDRTLADLERQLREVSEECTLYREKLAFLDSELDGRGGGQDSEFERAQERLAQEDVQLRQELQRVTVEKEGFDATLDKLKQEAAELDREEQQYWHDFNAFTVHRAGFAEERDVLLASSQRLAMHDTDLRNTNVYNDSFYIWHDGQFGTINGFRLGKLPDENVEWGEINAAWGQVCLLLQTMVLQKGFEFSRYTLKPMGSFSKVIEDGSTILDLYGTSGWFTTFDRAMIAFLQCLREFGEFAENSDPTLRLPYHIEGDRIGVLNKPDKWYPIKRRFESDEKWTNALKYMLTNLKWLVAWICRSTSSRQQVAARS